MSNASRTPAEFLRRVVLGVQPEMVLDLVDRIDVARTTLGPAIVVPLRELRQRRDVAAFAQTAPLPAVRTIVELICSTTLENIVHALGDSAEDPSFEELSAAVDSVLEHGSTRDEVVAVLGYAIVESFVAAPHCERLLSERPEFTLPELEARDDARTTRSEVNSEEREAIRERRRARRAEKRKKPATTSRPVRHGATRSESKDDQSEGEITTSVEPSAEPLTASFRPTRLTPAEQKRFSTEHPLVGYVIFADVAFEAPDPAQPEQQSKERPALVVAGGADQLLVRPIFSNEGARRHVFGAWRRLGLDHVSYVADDRFAVVMSDLVASSRRGPLSAEEWNSLM